MASGEPGSRCPWTRLAGQNDLAGEVVTGAEKAKELNHEGEEFAAGAKVRPGSIVVRRHGRTFVVNKKHPRQKARQG